MIPARPPCSWGVQPHKQPEATGKTKRLCGIEFMGRPPVVAGGRPSFHCPYLFTNDREENFSPMRRATMFEQENALPGSELHFTIANRHSLAGARQDHANMRWHIIAAFGTVREIIGVFRRQPIEEFFQIAPCGRIGVFHDDNAATGMLDKHCRRSVSHTAPVDL
jgi:hypothetical protein